MEAELPQLPEAVAWMHSQGDHCEPSIRQLDDGEIARGWRQEGLFTEAQMRRAILAERDRCAKLCDELALDEDCAAAIRAQP